MGNNKENRKRNVRKTLRFSEEENILLKQKMERCKYKNFSVFARKMLFNGQIFVIDFTEIKELNKILSSSSVNINQIAFRVNQTKNINSDDIIKLQKDVKILIGNHRILLNRLLGLM